MATYKEIQDYIKKERGYLAKTCWIAHMKEVYNLNPKIAANRHSQSMRKYPCPMEKQEDILSAFKYFDMI